VRFPTDAEYERDRLEQENEEFRAKEKRRESEAARERERQRRESHPSNRLYNGEVADFREAIRCQIAALEIELRLSRQWDVKGSSIFQKSIADANRALEIYDRVMKDAEKQVVEELKKEKLDEYADCLNSGDYTGLAI